MANNLPVKFLHKPTLHGVPPQKRVVVFTQTQDGLGIYVDNMKKVATLPDLKLNKVSPWFLAMVGRLADARELDWQPTR